MQAHRTVVAPAQALSLDHISHNGLRSSTEYPFALLRGFAQRLSLTLGPSPSGRVRYSVMRCRLAPRNRDTTLFGLFPPLQGEG